jgi:hypothetical protein
MTTIKATIKGRRLELDAPADWPDGTEVEIQPLTSSRNGECGAMSAEEIARTLAAMDLVESLDMTESEDAAWEAGRARAPKPGKMSN